MRRSRGRGMLKLGEKTAIAPLGRIEPVQEAEAVSTSLSRSQSMDALSGDSIELYDEVDIMRGDMAEGLVLEVVIDAVELIFNYPSGISKDSFSSQFWARHDATLTKLGYKSAIDFFSDRLKYIVIFVELNKRGHFIKSRKQRSKKLLAAAYYKLRTKVDDQEEYEKAAKVVKVTFKQILSTLVFFGHGVFKDNFTAYYASIYDEKIDWLSLDEYLKSVRGFVEKVSPVDGRPYFQADPALWKTSQVSLAQNEFIGRFMDAFGAPSNHELTSLMIFLRDEKSIAYVTTGELGARYSEFYGRPLKFREVESLYELIDRESTTLKITKQFQIDNQYYNIVHLKQIKPSKLIQPTQRELMDDDQVVIKDVFEVGPYISVVPIELHHIAENITVELNNRYDVNNNCNSEFDMVDIEDVFVNSCVAVKVEDNWYRGQIYGVDQRREEVVVRCVDTGVERKQVPLDSIRYLDEVFMDPVQTAITTKLASPRNQTDRRVRTMLLQLMEINNCFRVKIDSHKFDVCQTIAVFHEDTDITITGEYDDRVARKFQQITRSNSMADFDVEEQPEHGIPFEVTMMENERMCLVEIENNRTVHVAIKNKSQIFIDAHDVTDLVKQYDPRIEVKFRLLLRKCDHLENETDLVSIAEILEYAMESPLLNSPVLLLLKEMNEKILNDLQTNDSTEDNSDVTLNSTDYLSSDY